MTDPTKKLDDTAKSLSATRLVGSDALQRLEAQLSKASKLDIPKHLFDLPHVEPIRVPSQKEQNSYQSAGVLVKRLAQTVAQWRSQVSADSQPIVLALLPGGVQINVSLLAEESFHGLRIEGTIDGSPCMLLAHQASVQLLCYVAKVENETARRSIGFIIDGQESRA